MDITFGWGLDGAAWDEGLGAGGARAARVGHVTVGPMGLLEIIRTRFGLRGPEIPRPMRIAAYRAALEDAAPEWCARSFAVDPWAVAKRMLGWRDELVAAGWDGALGGADAGPGAGGDASPRLRALAAAERHFESPGPADALKEAVDVLGDLVAEGSGWPHGIDSVTVVGEPGDLPAPWPGVLAALEALGVTVAPAAAPGHLRELDIVSAATEWEAAESAARILATMPGASLVATAHTEVLDHELARRGLPRAGLSPTSDQRATSQIVPIFLAAITAPVDVHAVAAFLDLKVTVTNAESGEVRPVGIVPSRVRGGFLNALTLQPGVGGDAWRAVLDDLRAAAHATAAEMEGARHSGTGDSGANPASGTGRPAVDEHDVELAEALDAMVTVDALSFTGGTCPTGRIVGALGWLEGRLRSLGGALDAPELLRVSGTVATTIAVLRERASVTEQELGRIIADCCPEDPSPLAGAEAWDRPRRTAPGLIGGEGPVLWWGAVDPASRERGTWTPVEVDQLARLSVVVASPADIARARSAADLAGLRRAGRVIAVVPRSINGAATAIHPLLAFAATDVAASGAPVGVTGADDAGEFDVEKLLEELTGETADQVAGGTWSFGDARLGVHTPETWIPDAGAVEALAVDRTVADGRNLLPEKLSFSQIEKLLMHRMEWLLERRLGVSPGWQTDIPTGNRMIGSFLHAIVEEIVGAMQERGDFPVTEATVDALFDELLPQYASELALPGNARLRGQVRNEAREAIPLMFGTLAKAGMTVRAAEANFELPLELTLRAPGEGDDGGGEAADAEAGSGEKVKKHRVTVVGFRDLDAVDAAGDPVVVDMKYSLSKKKYPEIVESGRALQLATYAWSVTAADGASLPLAAVTSAYFELKFARFSSTHPGLSDLESTGPDMAVLWDRAVAAIEAALSEIYFGGLIHDEGNSLILRTRGTTDGEAKAIVERAATLDDMRGRFLPVESYKYTDYGVITGIEADLT